MSELAVTRCALVSILICIGYTVAGAIRFDPFITLIPFGIVAIALICSFVLALIYDVWMGGKANFDNVLGVLFAWFACTALAIYTLIIACSVHGVFDYISEDRNDLIESTSDTYRRLIREEDRKTHERTTQAPQQIRIILNRG